MGCVHTHQKIPAIEGCGSLSCVQNVVEKYGEDNQEARKVGRAINQATGPRAQ